MEALDIDRYGSDWFQFSIIYDVFVFILKSIILSYINKILYTQIIYVLQLLLYERGIHSVSLVFFCINNILHSINDKRQWKLYIICISYVTCVLGIILS
jgi:hypothetical protein